MSHSYGTLVRSSLITDATAIVMADGGLLEVKRGGVKGLKNNFSSAAAWAESLEVSTSTLTYSSPAPRVSSSTRSNKLDRVFSYGPDTPHWQIAKDMLDHFKTKVHFGSNGGVGESTNDLLIKCQIRLLKLNLSRPQYEEGDTWLPRQPIEEARRWYSSYLESYRRQAEREGPAASRVRYHQWISNPHVYMKIGDTMHALAYNEAAKKVIVDKDGFDRFQDITGGPVEFWAMWQGKITKMTCTYAF